MSWTSQRDSSIVRGVFTSAAETQAMPSINLATQADTKRATARWTLH